MLISCKLIKERQRETRQTMGGENNVTRKAEIELMVIKPGIWGSHQKMKSSKDRVCPRHSGD